MIDLTDIIVSIIALVGTIVTTVVVPLIRSKIKAADREKLYTITKIGVQAAEQLCRIGVIKKEERKQHVLDFLHDNGYTVDTTEIENLIESLVYELPELIIKSDNNEMNG